MLDKILSKKAFLSFVFISLVVGGIMSFGSMGKLEDPEIPVKAAVVITSYPGATAKEVEKEVTDILEKAIQRLEHIDHIESRSMPGLSEIQITIESGVPSSQLPQLWDHLRRKVNDAKGGLPSGAGAPNINDDFGDVSGIFMAISNDGHDYYDFQNYVDDISKELLDINGVKRIETFGKQREVVNISFNNEYFATLGVNPMMIFQAFHDQGQTVDAGSFVSGSQRIRVNIGNKFQSIDEIKNFEVKLSNGGRYRLGQIARVTRDFYDPVTERLKYNGFPAISLALSMEAGGNVIELGERVEERLQKIEESLPVGIEIHPVYFQHKNVDDAINDFMINLIESVLIVVVVLLLAMGFRAGLLIASGLVFTILTTFIVMGATGIELHRVSLAAIIIAMGMLVDNSIVVVDGILVDLQKGIKQKKAFVATAKKSAMPLLGATLVAILAFLPLAFNSTAAGEFLRPLFYVLAISLFLSWILALIQTPFMAQFFYRKGRQKKSKSGEIETNQGVFYRWFDKVIRFSLLHKSMMAILMVVLLVASFWSFKFVKKDFFPNSPYNQFLLEYYLPEGSDVSQVETDLELVQKEISQWEEIDFVVSALVRTPVRYTLSRPMNSMNMNYGELIISLKSEDDLNPVKQRLQEYVSQNYPQADARTRNYSSMGGDYKIQAMFQGPDDKVLFQLAEQAKAIMRKEEMAAFVNDNWRNPVKTLSPKYSQEKARKLGVTRGDMARAIAIATSGHPVGSFYDGEYRLPVMLKLNKTVADDVNQIASIPVWAGLPTSVSLEQLVDSIDMEWEYNVVRRYDAKRSIKVQADPAPGFTGVQLQTALTKKIEAIPLPEGYTLKWLGEIDSSTKANAALAENMPLAFLLMVIIIIGLFGNFRQPFIILCLMPLSFVGVILGFQVTGISFGFFSIIGTLGLMGMMIKNAVVLLDEINVEIKEGRDKLTAVINSAVSRLRPVMMASLTTILGMLPLLWDEMFKTMAVAIMFGLLVGTIITLIVVPVLYTVFYRVNTKALRK
ncbi:Multidrug efflux pump subunit AcrB [Saccharicrinis carchari]|uniref:Multidrug efflux pump subunit AcrB n=1 Tax=Saccharicrinis carchari TaxID=1168039 RepID=A0A521BG70_SACCC|nr:efflux RND transporter permease subunit [Saccharicrinis carchari]SMO46096.1 Multidrug efflux pump subunit AcrB [Saccharicrinis carchari]